MVVSACETSDQLAATESWIRGISVGLPALFLAVIVWITARLGAQGDMSVGDFVAVYGYVAVIVVPIAQFIEAAIDINQALVSAQRVVDFLAVEPDPHGDEPIRDATATLLDPASGLRVGHGEFAVVAAADRLEATEIIERLAGIGPSDTCWGDQRLADIEQAPLRKNILVLDDSDFLFAGPIHEVVFTNGNDTGIARDRVAFASGIDEMLRGLKDGWDAEITLRGTNLSGGQRQRLRLARALAADPHVLLALDPLSAVDAITESQVVERVRVARQGSTTLIFSNSATVLGAADVVHLVEAGRLVASGTHEKLAASNDHYRALVSRGVWDEDEEAS